MRFLKQFFRGVSVETPHFAAASTLVTRILFVYWPALALLLSLIFIVAWKSMESAFDRAIARNAQMQASTASQAMEHVLLETRNQLLLLAAGHIDRDSMLKAIKYKGSSGASPYREIAFMGIIPEHNYLLLNFGGDQPVAFAGADAANASGALYKSANERHEPGHVNISRPMEVSYPLVPVSNDIRTLSFHVLRFSTPIYDEDGGFSGILSLALDLGVLRDKFSMLQASVNAGEPRRGFFFDSDGWMMFQSETEPLAGKPLGSDLARAGFHGDFGRPGFSQAFRPSPEHLAYWSMVADVQSGKSGMFNPADSHGFFGEQPGLTPLSYAPVLFETKAGAEPQLVGGIAMLNNEGQSAGMPFRPGSIFLVTLALVLLLTGCGMLWIARSTGRKLNLLAQSINDSNLRDNVEPLELGDLPGEFENLRLAVNGIQDRLRQSRDREEIDSNARMRRKKRQPVPDLPASPVRHANVLVGDSPIMLNLFAKIKKASQVDADVLIVGETGTGKELVATAIHELSSRASGPFLSINCGALDEALLMDTLFGHVKGAFTEAKNSRKGAFLAASGGTLLLDEIGNAPPRVQQALLRALSTRRIRPLGNDTDIEFDTRIIAATNVDLLDKGGGFRPDLYYRLAVITIETSPLANRPEDIPALFMHFMGECRAGQKQPALPRLTYGALEKLMTHNWPGNVRELKNVVTRTLAFCENNLIMAEDINLGSDDSSTEYGEAEIMSSRSRAPADILEKLSPRQRQLWPLIACREYFSRQDYENIGDKPISPRTAQYDLQIMMRLGLISRSGKGPAQRYHPLYGQECDRPKQAFRPGMA